MCDGLFRTWRRAVFSVTSDTAVICTAMTNMSGAAKASMSPDERKVSKPENAPYMSLKTTSEEMGSA
jgi:hypothetical protein